MPVNPKLNRRHFLSHLAGAASLAGSASLLTSGVRAAAGDMKRNQKSAILLWMGGGPATIDLWDLKPGAATGGPFRPISTTGDLQICEHLPLMAQQMHHFAVVRNMSTREADHGRGRYYLHTGHVPDPNIEHPSYGSIVAKELAAEREELELPPFVAIGGDSLGPGFLGMTYAPFVAPTRGRIRNLEMRVEPPRMMQRMAALDLLERRFLSKRPGQVAVGHGDVLRSTYDLMTSRQMAAFGLDEEPETVRERYGDTGIGRGCLMARRLVETGVPFIEVDMGGWDTHSDNFSTLREGRLPQLDQAMSALAADLDQRGLLESTVILWMGEFGRTPRINGNAGRDHWARSWSVVVGGAGVRGGVAVGATTADGMEVDSPVAHSSEDLMATVLQSLGIPLETTYTSLNGRPMPIANYGKPIADLLS